MRWPQPQDLVLERLEKSGVQRSLRAEAEQEGDGRVLVRQVREGRQHRSAAQAGERKAEGRNRRLRHAGEVVAGHPAEAGGGEVSLLRTSDANKRKAGSDPGLFSFRHYARSEARPPIHWLFHEFRASRRPAHRGLTPPPAPRRASGNPCSPWRRRRRTSPCPTRSSGAPFFRRSTRSGFEMNGFPNAIRSAALASSTFVARSKS